MKDSPELRDFRFAGTLELLKMGLLSDDFRAIQPGNYNLVYTGELSDIDRYSQREKLDAVFLKFNTDHPEGFKEHSLSVSDIVVLHKDGRNSAHFVDSVGFMELPEETAETELAFRIADRYINIQETDGGYDYSIMDAKLAEYKPLAKIEEMEEQNYNMVDNVPNNGAGEKAGKGRNKTEYDKPASRMSLKARLAEKKAQVAGQGTDVQENTKNKHREM